MASPPSLPAKIRKAPKAFAKWAEAVNESIDALRVITNLKAGTGMQVTWSQQNVVITNTLPDIPIYAGAGISVAGSSVSIVITNLNP